jgi:ABC-2 type transport system permease protein
MWTLFQIELFKIFRRPRTYIAFAAITALIGMVQLGLKVDGKEYASFVMADFNSSFALEGNLLNGYFVCFIVLQLLLIPGFDGIYHSFTGMGCPAGTIP